MAQKINIITQGDNQLRSKKVLVKTRDCLESNAECYRKVYKITKLHIAIIEVLENDN